MLPTHHRYNIIVTTMTRQKRKKAPFIVWWSGPQGMILKQYTQFVGGADIADIFGIVT